MVLYVNNRRHRGPQLLTSESIAGDGRRSTSPTPLSEHTAKLSLGECTSVELKAEPPGAAIVKPANKVNLPKTLDTEIVWEAGDEIDCRNSGSLVRSGKGRRTRHVRFGYVSFQEHAVTVGDHPECKGNFPLTLDWGHTPPTVMDMKAYESGRSQKFQLHMDVRERYDRLRLVTGLTDSKLVCLEQRRLRLQIKSLQPARLVL